MVLLQPGGTGDRLIARKQRNLEAAVAVEERGRAPVERQRLGANLEIGHPRAVLGDGLVLAYVQSRDIEKCR